MRKEDHHPLPACFCTCHRQEATTKQDVWQFTEVNSTLKEVKRGTWRRLRRCWEHLEAVSVQHEVKAFRRLALKAALLIMNILLVCTLLLPIFLFLNSIYLNFNLIYFLGGEFIQFTSIVTDVFLEGVMHDFMLLFPFFMLPLYSFFRSHNLSVWESHREKIGPESESV